jgi:putative RNA 2'-phosphotransferase
MDERRLRHVSKYLSKHLRHTPERLGLTLAPGGWADVEELLAACNRDGMRLSRAELELVVARNNKQRFAFDTSGTLIRANQGHSIPIDLGLELQVPPPHLYHGTASASVPAILRHGLRKMARHHVHLSADLTTARTVGRRHGQPAIFEVDTAAMDRQGYHFFQSANRVWLTEHVPPAFLRLLVADQG